MPRSPSLLLATVLPSLLPAQAPASPHWAFEPLTTTAPRPASDPAWNGSPIDRFVFAGLQAQGLQPSPPADRRTLLRRAAFLLTGLPPTPASVAALLADPAPDAFATAVDALLASPHYGERQARHWLDLARYSDSNGLDENLAYGNAFRYRDWVVRAFDQDLPFDRFGTLQLAGDLLPPDDPGRLDGLCATGFLALGPKMLAEQDKTKLVLDIVDEQLDLVGRTFLGLTLGCARCHDHKFDPVSQRDYYALAGVFRSTRTLANLDHVSRWHDAELSLPAARAERERRQQELDAAAKALAAVEAEAMAAERRALLAAAGKGLLAAAAAWPRLQFVEAEDAMATSLHTDRSTWGAPDCVVLHTQMPGEQFAEYELRVPADGDYRLDVRLAAKESRPLRVRVDGDVALASTLAGVTGDWFPAQQQWLQAGTLHLAAGSHRLRLEALSAHTPHLDCLLLAGPGALDADGLPPELVRQFAFGLHRSPPDGLLGLLLRLAGTPPAGFAAAALAAQQSAAGDCELVLAGLPPTTLPELVARYQTLFLAAMATAPAAEAKPTPAEPLAAVRQLLTGPHGLLALPQEARRALWPAPLAARVTAATAARDAAAKAVPAAGPRAMCVAEGDMVELPVHLRGNHLTLAAEPQPRGFLPALATVTPPPIPAGSSGRRELARWLFDPANPLTPRVQANRIWQHCFGQGLVRTPSNFGRRGDLPVQRGLLDWLAAELQRDGWSQKRLLRTILLSRAWQQQSLDRPAAAAVDPDNRWLWRQQRVRLEAEAFRDSLLATAGTLDRSRGGTLLATGDRDYVTNDQSNDQARYGSHRRSLYLPVIRNAMYDLFTAFDYADPSVHLEQRPASVVAPQALQLLNSPLVREQSRAFAAAAMRAAGDQPARIAWIWQQALQRAPSAREAEAAAAFLQRARQLEPDQEQALAGLCQMVFATNEFLYVD